jgi:exodeoxyribonuclease V alpha subunit
MITLEGIVSSITFQNEDSGFTVIHLKKEETADNYTCVGTMPTIVAGESVRLNGEWESHKKFGKQFSVKSYEIVRPTTLEGIKMLLGSGFISNIGPVRAQSIIDTFGIDTLNILDTNPERLLEVAGIGQKFFAKIKESWERQKHLRSLIIFLQQYNVSLNLVMKIYKTYGIDAQKKICENPYVLVEDVWGVGFVKADAIAQKMGFTHDSYKRIRAGMMFIMQDASTNGHVFLPTDELTEKTSELLNVKVEQAVFSLDHALEIKLFIKEDDCIYLPVYYHAEKQVAENIKKRLHNQNSHRLISNKIFVDWVDAYQSRNSWNADPKQIDALKFALSNQLLLLTGGPGTGKTTTLQMIVMFFKEQQYKIALAAPTGRAAQRMGCVANLNALTIHRLLEFKPSERGFIFARNESNPVDADIVIIDEVSMIDLLLMRQLLIALKPQAMVMFVGDNNQLPSVGAGNVLADFIKSNVIPHIHLTTIFRQAKSSRIITSAHELINGAVPHFSNLKTDDSFLLVKDDPQLCLDTICELVSQRLPKTYNFNPVNDIQVLSPMHKSLLGTENLNATLQKVLNKNTKRIIRGLNCFVVGDKVMQIRNNYDMGVFNGDIGIISDIIDEEAVEVDYDGRMVTYELADLEEIVLAYCISIHKSQGCEFKAVIIPISTQHYIMLQRNLIYTALTRAKKLCILVGTEKALSIAVRNNQAFLRNSRLGDLLK